MITFLDTVEADEAAGAYPSSLRGDLIAALDDAVVFFNIKLPWAFYFIILVLVEVLLPLTLSA